MFQQNSKQMLKGNGSETSEAAVGGRGRGVESRWAVYGGTGSRPSKQVFARGVVPHRQVGRVSRSWDECSSSLQMGRWVRIGLRSYGYDAGCRGVSQVAWVPGNRDS